MDLVILAAGMGSRFGGLKQIEPIDSDGNFIIDYTIYDAIKIGFDKVIFIIKKENYDYFKNTIGKKISKNINVEYVFQEIDSYVPYGVKIEFREKPWGTAHAILCAKNKIKDDFVVVNADDFYGRESLKNIYQFLKDNKDTKNSATVCYKAINTLTESGVVKRGVCDILNDSLIGFTESYLEKINGDLFQSPLNTKESFKISPNKLVSMNLFGFNKNMLDFLQKGFENFIIANSNDLSVCEYYITTILTEYINQNKGSIKVLETNDKWYGLTYKQDFENVCNGINEMVETGLYPKHLWY